MFHVRQFRDPTPSYTSITEEGLQGASPSPRTHPGQHEFQYAQHGQHAPLADSCPDRGSLIQ
jgi:hypothetical protein